LNGGVIPGDDLLPDDWDKDLLEGISPPASTPAPPSRRPMQEAALPHTARAVPQAAVPPMRHRPPEPALPPSAQSAAPFDEPAEIVTPVAAPRPPAATAQPQAGTSDTALLAAFLRGVGLPDALLTDPAATMQALGKAFRNLVSGLRAVLIARAAIKSEFRIEQTMIRARGNNPLKFSADDDDALAALLGTGRRTDMTPHEAVADALRDIRLHELATMAAMQAAVRAMLDGLDPARLRANAEQGGGVLLPAQKKARAWDAYEALHARTVQALADDFDSAFGKAFARAYERSLDEISAKERR
jgi:type VI secretion system FHA domain protein